MSILTIVAGIGLFVGCATTGGGGKELDAQDRERIAALFGGNVEAVALSALAEDDDGHVRDYLVLAKATISGVLASDDQDPLALRQAITDLPVKEFQTLEGRLAVNAVLTAYEIYLAEGLEGTVDRIQLRSLLLTAAVAALDRVLANQTPGA